MTNKFDELTKSLAQAVTRRQALKKFAGGVVEALAASLEVRTVSAAPPGKNIGYCEVVGFDGGPYYDGTCWDPVTCQHGTSSDCSGRTTRNIQIESNPCNPGPVGIDLKKRCSF